MNAEGNMQLGYETGATFVGVLEDTSVGLGFVGFVSGSGLWLGKYPVWSSHLGKSGNIL